jgi:hypothetical protein
MEGGGGGGEKFPTEVKLPEIKSGSARGIFPASKLSFVELQNCYKEDTKLFFDYIGKWLQSQPKGRLIIQEKMDGSNFTVYPDPTTGELVFFNKGKKIEGNHAFQSVFERTCEALTPRAKLFLPGYIYHGEAFRATRSCHVMYKTVPKFHWICYEIMIPLQGGGFKLATPEEMTELLCDTGLQQAQIYYDSQQQQHLETLISVFLNINTLPSCLGNYAEGVVVKVLDRGKKGKVVPFRQKFVSDHMRERKTIEGVFAPDLTVESIGDMFNVPARFRKAYQHLEERGEDTTSYPALTKEADDDLEKEYKEEIKEMLWNRYHKVIKKAARKDLAQVLGLKMEEKK